MSQQVAKLVASKCCGKCHGHGEGGCHKDEFNGYNVTVVKKSSDFQLIRFVVGMINEETNRHLKVQQRAGSVVVTEDDQLLFVHLPEDGVAASAFFGESSENAFGDTILIATRNEGKTKEFRGVWSARFSGPDATDESNNAKLLHELAMVFDMKDRSAQFHTTLVVAAPDKESLVVEADWPGYIAMEAKGDNGFGYDPLFLVGETGRHAAELTADEKNEISHRGLAVKKLMEAFPVWKAE